MAKQATVTAEVIRIVQAEHKKNVNVSAKTIGETLALDLPPSTIVQIIEGRFNYLCETHDD